MPLADFLRREGESDSAYAERTRALMAAHPLTGAAKLEDDLMRARDTRNGADAAGDVPGAAEAANRVHLIRSHLRGMGRNVEWSRESLTR